MTLTVADIMFVVGLMGVVICLFWLALKLSDKINDFLGK